MKSEQEVNEAIELFKLTLEDPRSVARGDAKTITLLSANLGVLQWVADKGGDLDRYMENLMGIMRGQRESLAESDRIKKN
jgi:hypothetical protein